MAMSNLFLLCLLFLFPLFLLVVVVSLFLVVSMKLPAFCVFRNAYTSPTPLGFLLVVCASIGTGSAHLFPPPWIRLGARPSSVLQFMAIFSRASMAIFAFRHFILRLSFSNFFWSSANWLRATYDFLSFFSEKVLTAAMECDALAAR